MFPSCCLITAVFHWDMHSQPTYAMHECRGAVRLAAMYSCATAEHLLCTNHGLCCPWALSTTANSLLWCTLQGSCLHCCSQVGRTHGGGVPDLFQLHHGRHLLPKNAPVCQCHGQPVQQSSKVCSSFLPPQDCADSDSTEHAARHPVCNSKRMHTRTLDARKGCA